MKSTLRRNVVGLILAVLILLTLFSATSLLLQPVAAQGPGGTPTVGKPWRGAPGITETVAQIMEREKHAQPITPGTVRAIPRRTDHRKLQRVANPAAPQAAQMGIPQESALNRLPSAPNNPQTVGTSFLGAQLSESGLIPPDSMGALGPTQILVAVNGRIKVFDKSGTLGSLDADLTNFFSQTVSAGPAFDPRTSYDRLSGRWFVTALDGAAVNRVMIAVSSGSTITNSSSFTFYQFQHDLVGPTPNVDTGLFADYDSLGVDKFSLYIGVNGFTSPTGVLSGTTGFVVNKSGLLTGTLTVTAFRQLSACNPITFVCTTGPLSPRGVDNDDPSATEGYFIGVDGAVFSLLTMRRVTYPGGVPTISGNLFTNVPTTTLPIDVPAKGSTRTLDGVDDRLFAAMIHKNKVTGVKSLWTAHNIEVDSSGVATGGGGRDGSRWYEIINFTTVPTLNQSGTLYDSATTNPRSYWIPSVAMSGQGHMALGASYASANDYPGVVVAGRFFSDSLGTIQSPTIAQTGVATYTNNAPCPGDPLCGKRWGDYSQTVVDPNDDMTMWTAQEYSNSSASMDWATRVIQLIAPPPATISTVNPNPIAQGQAFVNVTVTGTSASGSGFFDPGPDTGGPGFLKHIAATATGGVIVNSVSFISPTQVTLNISTFCASAGSQDITIINPDGQSATGFGILTITAAPTNCVRTYLPLISK